MKIFLDDFRTPIDAVKYMHQRIGKLNPIYLEQWETAKNYNQFVEWVNYSIETGEEITHISFDHDLADEHYAPETWQEGGDYTYKEKTGLDCAKWLLNVYTEMGKTLPVIFVHSMNPVGTENILNVFKS